MDQDIMEMQSRNMSRWRASSHGSVNTDFACRLHHWQQYHGDGNDREEDLTHPEDIEHYKHHDQLEDEADRQAELDRRPIVSENIPSKFKRKA